MTKGKGRLAKNLKNVEVRSFAADKNGLEVLEVRSPVTGTTLRIHFHRESGAVTVNAHTKSIFDEMVVFDSQRNGVEIVHQVENFDSFQAIAVRVKSSLTDGWVETPNTVAKDAIAKSFQAEHPELDLQLGITIPECEVRKHYNQDTDPTKPNYRRCFGKCDECWYNK